MDFTHASYHHVFWTGGWDSTYRVLELAVIDKVVVQPWYILGLLGRLSTDYELRAIDRIRAELSRRDPEAAARILPSLCVRDNEVKIDRGIVSEIREAQKFWHIAEQQKVLASLAKEMGVRFEVGLHADDGESIAAVRKYLVQAPDGVLELTDDGVVPDGLSFYRFFRFPLIDLTKLELGSRATAAGFSDLLEYSWFCHAPFMRKPCGYCPPCDSTRKSGLASRVPRKRLARAAAVTAWRIPQATLGYVRSGGRHWLGPKVTISRRVAARGEGRHTQLAADRR